MRIYWIALAIIVAGITFLVAADLFTDFDTARGDQIVSVVALSAVLITLGAGSMRRYSGQSGQFLKHIAIWLGIIAVLAIVYQYREMLGLNFD
jgi:predicted aspartyl protease